MFDNIGRDLDEEATRRSAISLFITLAGIGGSVAFVVAVGAYTAAQVAQNTDLDEQLVEMIEEVMTPDLPPPPPPPPPAAAQPDNPEEEQQDEPDDLNEEVQELKDQVDDAIKSDVKPAGVVGGVEGGVVGGVVGGQLGGTGVKVFHHSELEVKKRIQPEYPETAKALNLGDQRCLVTVRIDEEGVPYEVNVDGCPKVFHDSTREAILKWRWYPAKDGKSRVKAQTTIAVTYKLT